MPRSHLAPRPPRRLRSMLTKKQHELLLFINRRLTDTGVSPSFEEMKEALKLKSKSGIHRLISGLEERGFIKRLAHRARAHEGVKLPEETAVATPRAERARFSPTVIRGDYKSPSSCSPIVPPAVAARLPTYLPLSSPPP